MIAKLHEQRDSLKRNCLHPGMRTSNEEYETKRKYRQLRSPIDRTIEEKNQLDTRYVQEIGSIREEFDEASRKHEDEQK